MTIARKFEFACGAATLILGIVATLITSDVVDTSRLDWILSTGFDALVLFIIPGLLVATGSYLHAVRRKRIGFIVLLVGGIFLTIMMLIHLFGGVFYLFGFWGALAILSQSLLSMLTVISSLVVVSLPQ